MTKILLWAALAYATVAIAAILIDDGVTDARPRPTTTMIIDVAPDLVEDAVELRTARTDGPVDRASASHHSSTPVR
jgi:hypothetical protein